MRTLLTLILSIGMMVAVTANSAVVGEWTFNEGSGNVAEDTSGNNNNGTIDQATWVQNGKYGSALDFNGTNGSVVVENKDILAPKDAASVTAWAFLRRYPEGDQCCLCIFSKGGDHKDFDIQVESDKLIKFYLSSTPNNYNVISKTEMTLNEWVFIVVTYKANDAISIYVNGKLENTTEITEARDPSTEPVRIGVSSWPNRFWDGMLDEVRLFDTALNEAEIENMMTNPTAVSSKDGLTTVWGQMKSK